MRIDPIKLTSKIPNQGLRFRALDRLLEIVIPFNRGLGFRIKELSSTQVVVACPESKKRRNHVGSAHAGLLVTLGEYPAGLLISQSFPVDHYRLIMGHLEVDYHKRGYGLLTATALRPRELSAQVDPQNPLDEDLWLDLVTEIRNESSELVAEVRTRWQVKAWEKSSQSAKP